MNINQMRGKIHFSVETDHNDFVIIILIFVKNTVYP